MLLKLCCNCSYCKVSTKMLRVPEAGIVQCKKKQKKSRSGKTWEQRDTPCKEDRVTVAVKLTCSYVLSTDLQGNILSRAGRQDNNVFSGAKKEDADLFNLCHEFGFGGCFVSLGSGMVLEVAMLSSGWRWTK